MIVGIRAARTAAGMSQSQRRALAGPLSRRLAQHRDSIRPLVGAHHAKNPRVFGSVARGEDRPGSDIDFLVAFADEAPLLDEIGLRLALTDLTQAEVDVVADDALHGVSRERVLGEAVPV